MNKKSNVASFLSFYCFKQSFCCVKELTEELAGIAGDICNFAEAAKNRSWFEFWQAQGNEIALRLWNIKYKDYIHDPDEGRSLGQVLAEEKSDTEKKNAYSNPESVSLNESSINEVNNLNWQTLWHDHNAEVYTDQYKKFEHIYENYYWVLKEALSNQIDQKITNTKYYNEFSNEFEQLKLAGLPTAFGSKSRSNHKKSKTKFKKKQAHEHFYDLIEADFNELDKDVDNDNDDENDDDDESDIYFSATDTSDHEYEMPPIKNNHFEERFDQNDNGLHKTQSKTICKSKKNQTLRFAPAFMQEEKKMQKYWRQRFSLFSRFDEGIQLDRESWFSVTPEKVAQHMAQRITREICGTNNEGLTIVDGFCGCGGNTIQFAMTCKKVIAIDIDAKKIEMAKHNANIYGVADKIEFIVGDFLQVSQEGNLKANAVFLSPPWGGPEYISVEKYNIETCLEPVSASELMRVARCISNNIAFFLPRNSDIKQIIRLAGVGNTCEIEHNFLDTRIVGLTAFYGDCVAERGD